MELRLIIMALVCLCIAQLAFADQDNYPFETKAQQQRFVNLTKELRCAECQNQTLFDSNAPLAIDMRAQVFNMILGGQTDNSIRDFLSYRYGEFILFDPPLRFGTWLLWGGPLLMFILALLAMLRYFKLNSLNFRHPINPNKI
jgi:cytochrome c-type biogenesis protein CcmH